MPRVCKQNEAGVVCQVRVEFDRGAKEIDDQAG